MRPVLLFFFLQIFVFTAIGQVLSDSSILKKSKANALAQYNSAMEGNLHVYNGSEYIPYRPLEDEHPFFISSDWTNGDILYDGEWFNDLPMLFDLERGLVVISYYFKGIKMQLNTDRIYEFNIHGHRFINLKQVNDSLDMKRGFYEVLYSGKTTTLVKHSKKYTENLHDNQIEQDFKESSQAYVFSQGTYHKVSSKASVLGVLADKKKELKGFIKQNRLFTTDRLESIQQVAKFYDSLKP